MTEEQTPEELDITEEAKEVAEDTPEVEPEAADLPDDTKDGDLAEEEE